MLLANLRERTLQIIDVGGRGMNLSSITAILGSRSYPNGNRTHIHPGVCHWHALNP